MEYKYSEFCLRVKILMINKNCIYGLFGIQIVNESYIKDLTQKKGFEVCLRRKNVYIMCRCNERNSHDRCKINLDY